MSASYLGRQLNIGDYALAGFSRRLGRNIGIVLVFALVIFLVASFSLTTTSLQESARRLLAPAGAHLPVSIGPKAVVTLEAAFGNLSRSDG